MLAKVHKTENINDVSKHLLPAASCTAVCAEIAGGAQGQ